VGDDLVGALGPGERVGALVPAVDVNPDCGFEVFDAVEGAAADRLAGDDPEEDLNQFIHDPEVGVKCSVTRGFLASHLCTLGCLWVA